MARTVDLTAYRDWLQRTGRSPSTVATYCRVLKRALQDDVPEQRLVDRTLAPKTRGVLKFALKSWYRFGKQTEQIANIEEIRLPPQNRREAKSELIMQDWRRLVDAIRKIPTHKPGAAAIQCVLLMMGLRGFRVGDVMRMTQREVREALKNGQVSFDGKGGKRLTYDIEMVREPLAKLLSLGTQWKLVADLCAAGGVTAATGYMRCHRALKRCAAQAGIAGVHIHRLRRTYATHYLKNLKNDPQALIKLQRHMGWSNITTAALYADNVTQEDLADNASTLITQLLADRKSVV